MKANAPASAGRAHGTTGAGKNAVMRTALTIHVATNHFNGILHSHPDARRPTESATDLPPPNGEKARTGRF